MTNIGSLDKRIIFIDYVEIENEYGLTELQAVKKLKCWARIEPTRGKEYYEAQKTSNENQYKILIRYRKNINSSMLIRYKEKEFEIISIVNPYMADEQLELYCREKTRG